MSKTKNNQIADKLGEVGLQAGIVLMATAATIGLLDLPDQPDKRVIVPNQPHFAFATENNGDSNTDNTLRREREEAGPHYISYSVAQRTPGRHGRA
jgi:hypothetical protein